MDGHLAWKTPGDSTPGGCSGRQAARGVVTWIAVLSTIGLEFARVGAVGICEAEA